MDFFKSILAEPDPDPASPPPEVELEPESRPAGSASSPPAAPTPTGGGGGGWGFGGLLRTLTSQSETVLEAYRRDLAEFGTGLRRETEVLREAAARAARDLPSSAHALDGLADIVAQGKDALSQAAAAAAAAHSDGGDSEPASASGAHVRYSRFEAQLRALQADPATFTSDPEDGEDFVAWREGFSLEEREEEIEALCYDSDALEAMADKLVPDAVEREVFWARYFYRAHKLKQQEDARAKLVQRAIAQEEEEDLSWEVDDDDDTVVEENKPEASEKENERLVQESRSEAAEQGPALEKEDSDADEPQPVVLASSLVVVDEKGEQENADEPQPVVFGSSLVVVSEDEKEELSKPNVVEESSDKKEGAKHETSDSSKDSDYSIVSRQRTTEEEDLEWDEIEDLGEHEEKKDGGTHGSSPALKELRKRLSVAEDDEDLSWDIEDDDDKA
ncbi:hypothetical protein U9M48_016049 [Paspalum notatum var. saurae]|uniref:BSD domain-containing protein n=1 Tax=Paspalum notatum var. saurae TaxID=547442 RepID=A0AAQ3T6I7_PASNO